MSNVLPFPDKAKIDPLDIMIAAQIECLRVQLELIRIDLTKTKPAIAKALGDATKIIHTNAMLIANLEDHLL